MKKTLGFIVSLGLLLAFTGSAFGAGLNQLKTVSSHPEDSSFVVTLEFETPPEVTAKYFEKSIQLEIGRAMIAPAKQEITVDQAGISRIQAYQFDRETVRIRLFPEGEIKPLQDTLKIVRQGNVLALTFQEILLPATTTTETHTGEAEADPSQNHNVKEPSPALPETGSTEDASKIPANGDQPPARDISDIVAGLKSEIDDIDQKADAMNALTTPVSEQSDIPGGAIAEAGFLNYSEPEVPEVPSIGSTMVKVGSALMIVLALMLVLAFGAKQYLNGMQGNLGAREEVKVLSNTYIGVKKSITMVEVGGDILVLGVTNNNISILAKYDDPQKIEKIKLHHRLPSKPLGIFKGIPGVSTWLNKGAKKKSKTFLNQVENYKASLKEREAEKPSAGAESKEELVSKVTRNIASRLKTMEQAAG